MPIIDPTRHPVRIVRPNPQGPGPQRGRT